MRALSVVMKDIKERYIWWICVNNDVFLHWFSRMKQWSIGYFHMQVLSCQTLASALNWLCTNDSRWRKGQLVEWLINIIRVGEGEKYKAKDRWYNVGNDHGKPGLLWGFNGLSTLWIGVGRGIWLAKNLPWRNAFGLYTSKSLSFGLLECSDWESFSVQGAKERVNGL